MGIGLIGVGHGFSTLSMFLFNHTTTSTIITSACYRLLLTLSLTSLTSHRRKMEFGMGMGAAPAPAYGTSNCVPAYLYGLPSADKLRIDDLLDFSNQDVFASATVTDRHHIPHQSSNCYPQLSSSFADDIYVPSEEAAELEWLSNFVEDSFSYVPYPAASIPHATALTTAQSSSSSTSSSSSSDFRTPRKRNVIGVDGVEESGVRRCTHCASEKTPQWRTGPLGPKTLCNACGVRYKSGRLVPEYRPAASPTFVLTQHSNSHRKVMELRRQKEVHHQRQPNESVIYQDRLVSLS